MCVRLAHATNGFLSATPPPPVPQNNFTLFLSVGVLRFHASTFYSRADWSGEIKGRLWPINDTSKCRGKIFLFQPQPICWLIELNCTFMSWASTRQRIFMRVIKPIYSGNLICCFMRCHEFSRKAALLNWILWRDKRIGGELATGNFMIGDRDIYLLFSGRRKWWR